MMELCVMEPEKAREMIRLSVVLGIPVSDRLIQWFDLDVNEERAAVWGRQMVDAQAILYPKEADE